MNAYRISARRLPVCRAWQCSVVARRLAVSSFATSVRQAAVDKPASSKAPAAEGETAEPAAAPAAPKSSCPAGTVLTGLNYFKGKTDPVALPDEEYPAWLWKCLDVMKKTTTTEEDDAGDEFSKSKKQRRMAAKRQRELETQMLASGDMAALAPKIPLQHQTINLDVGSGDVNDLESTLLAAANRKDLRVAMRKERRAHIKENNYLRSM